MMVKFNLLLLPALSSLHAASAWTASDHDEVVKCCDDGCAKACKWVDENPLIPATTSGRRPTNGIPSRRLDVDVVAEYCCVGGGAGTGGDPHFTLFNGNKYDFHGGCDMVLLQNPQFADGLGLNIHIRTQIKATWSHIKAAAVQIGENVLEITAGTTHLVQLNGEEAKELQTGEASLGDYAVKFTRINDHQTRTRIDLGSRAGDAISIETFKAFVRVNVSPKTPTMFAGSNGLLGSYPTGRMMARDGVTLIKDANEFGQEWRLREGESMLFHDADSVEPLETCPMPNEATKAEARRRLGETAVTKEDAALACARVEEANRDACIFDVLATNDKDMAGSY